MKKKLLIATKNPGKFAEIRQVLADLPFEIIDLAGLNISHDYAEGDHDYENNALGKARHFHSLSGILTVADDSGIEIDALPGELGVKTRRWGGEQATDQEWIEYFFEKMKDVEEAQRGAKFVCAIALAGSENGQKFEYVFKADTRGIITQQLEAEIVPGIPLSSCFRPAGFDKVYSLLAIEEKNKISHRGKAVLKLREFLGQQKEGRRKKEEMPMNEVLRKIEEFDRRQPSWIVDRATARLLCIFIKILSRKFGDVGRSAALRVLEIGGGVGYSAIWMGLELKKIEGVLYTVESHDERFSLAEKHFKKAGLDNVFQIKGHAPEALDLIPGDFEMAFFDATKYEHVAYLEKVLPRMKRGGVILVDNALSHQAELQDFFNYVKTLAGIDCTLVLDVGKGVAVIGQVVSLGSSKPDAYLRRGFD